MNVPREAIFKRGASFYKDGDTVYFRFQADASSVVVAKANDQHKAEYPLEWRMYLDAAFNGADPAKFDHDQSGSAGGSASAVSKDAETVLEQPQQVTPKRRGRPPKKV